MKKKWLLICSVLTCLGILGFCMDHKLTKDDALGKIVGGCGSGPCFSIGIPDCGWEPEEQNCVRSDQGGCDTLGDGCVSRCGPGSSNEACFGLIGKCTESYVDCAEVISNSCTAYVGGCKCKGTGSSGWYCSRSNC
jgi:hypothetical protein